MNINEFSRGVQIPIIESGSYAAVCCGIVDLGTQQGIYNGEERYRSELVIIFEIPDELVEINGEMVPRQISKRFAKSVNEKASFRSFLKSWRGHDFTQAELEDFDLKNMLGVPAVLNIVHNVSKSNGNTYAYLDGVVKLMKGMTVGGASVSHYFNIGMAKSWPCFAKLPEWIRETINKSKECEFSPFVVDEEGNVSVTPGEPNSAFLPNDEGGEDISFVPEVDEQPTGGPNF